MTRKEMKKELVKQYELANERMFNMRRCEKLYNQHYGERQAIGDILTRCGFMTKSELQHLLDECNDKLGWD